MSVRLGNKRNSERRREIEKLKRKQKFITREGKKLEKKITLGEL